MQIEISDTCANEIVVSTLLDYLRSNISDRDRLSLEDDLPSHRAADLRDAKKAIRDLVRVLRHYTTMEEFQDRVTPFVPEYKRYFKNRPWG